MKPKNYPLFIYLNHQLMGQLTNGKKGNLSFQYDQSWLNIKEATPISHAIPLSKEVYTGQKVIAVFENLLPDSAIDKRNISKNVKALSSEIFSLLAEIGKDCVGAFQILQSSPEPTEYSKALEKEELNETLIEKMLIELDEKPLGLHHTSKFRLSIGGVQKKTALLLHENKWWKPIGATPTTHILKPEINNPDIELYKSVENEFYCLKILELFGLPVNSADIKTFGATKTLVIKRFDRKWTTDGKLERIQQEDLCQALSFTSDKKYQNDGGPTATKILNFLANSENNVNDIKTFFTSLVLFNLLGATDGHAKNYSIFLGRGGSFHLTPLYDVLSIQPSIDFYQFNKNFKMSLSVGKNRHYHGNYIKKQHYIETVKKANIDENLVSNWIDEIIESFESVFDKVESYLQSDFPREIHESVKQGATKRLSLLKN